MACFQLVMFDIANQERKDSSTNGSERGIDMCGDCEAVWSFHCLGRASTWL